MAESTPPTKAASVDKTTTVAGSSSSKHHHKHHHRRLLYNKRGDGDGGGENNANDTDNDAPALKDEDIKVNLRKQLYSDIAVSYVKSHIASKKAAAGMSSSPKLAVGLSLQNTERIRLMVRRFSERRRSSRVQFLERPMSSGSSSSSSSSTTTSREVSTLTSERDDDAAKKQEVFRKRLAQIFGERADDLRTADGGGPGDKTAASGGPSRRNAFHHSIESESEDEEQKLRRVACCGKSLFLLPLWAARLRTITMPSLTVEPQSYGYICWLAIVTCAFLYNAFTIPLRTLFEFQNYLQNPYYWLLSDGFCDLIYLIDMLGVRPLMKFVREGLLMQRYSDTARHYFASRAFRIDLLALLPFNYFMYLNLFVGHAVPALRLPRMLKVLSYWEFFNRVETIASIPNVLRILKTVMYMLYLVHINSGFYYCISYYERTLYNATNEWVFSGTDQKHAYIRCTYQALKLAIKIGHNPIPLTSRQRAFHTFSLLMGIFVFAILVGQIRDIYTSISAREASFRRQLDLTVRYLQKLKIPYPTIDKVRAWFVYNWKFQKTLDENDYVAFLPRKLKTDLALSVHYHTIAKVTLFQDVEQGLISELVMMLRPRLYLPNEYVCRRGEVGTEMFIIKYGLVEVVGGPSDTTVLATLGEGTVIGEIALLSLGGDNRRTAHVRSKGISQLFVLSKVDLERALLDYPSAQDVLRKKARAIIRQSQKKRQQEQKQQLEHQQSVKQQQKVAAVDVAKHHPQDGTGDGADHHHNKQPPEHSASYFGRLTHGGSEYSFAALFARLLPRANFLRKRLGTDDGGDNEIDDDDVRGDQERVEFFSTSHKVVFSSSTPNLSDHHNQAAKSNDDDIKWSSAQHRREMRRKTYVPPSALREMHNKRSSTNNSSSNVRYSPTESSIQHDEYWKNDDNRRRKLFVQLPSTFHTSTDSQRPLLYETPTTPMIEFDDYSYPQTRTTSTSPQQQQQQQLLIPPPRSLYPKPRYARSGAGESVRVHFTNRHSYLSQADDNHDGNNDDDNELKQSLLQQQQQRRPPPPPILKSIARF